MLWIILITLCTIIIYPLSKYIKSRLILNPLAVIIIIIAKPYVEKFLIKK